MKNTAIRRVVITIATFMLTYLVLNAFTPTAGFSVFAQDDTTPTPASTEEPTATPTATPTLTPTPLPKLQIQARAELAPDGDLNGDGLFSPGDVVLYTIDITNTDAQTREVSVVATFDSAYISGIADISSGGAAGDNEVTWVVDRINRGQTLTLTYKATLRRIFPRGRTQVTGAVAIRADTVEIARTTIPAFEVNGPNLRFVEEAIELVTDSNSNGRIDPGDTVRFTLSYSNSGGGPSQESTIVIRYPGELTAEIVNNPDNATLGEGLLTWNIGSIPADNELRAVRFTVLLKRDFPSGVITYDLAATIQRGETLLDERKITTKVSGPNLVLTTESEFVLDADGDELVDKGDELLLTVTVSNVGTDSATGVAINAAMTASQYSIGAVSNSGTPAEDGTGVSWAVGSLAAGATTEVTVSLTALQQFTSPAGSRVAVNVTSEQTPLTSVEFQPEIDLPTPTPAPSPTTETVFSETRPAQGQGILAGSSVAFLIGGFLFLSLLALVFVASRVLPGTAEERNELDPQERSQQRRVVRELIEGVILTAILFTVMILGLQNALDQDSVNSIIAGIVGYVAGRVSSQK